MNIKKVLIFSMVFSLIPICNPLLLKGNNTISVYAKEKKKPKGKKIEGSAKVWNGEEFVNTDESISPKANNTVFGSATEDNSMPENCVKPGKMITKDGNYYYELEDGTLAQTTWVNVDIDNDGVYEYLYFGPGGVMKVNGVTPNGSKVNEYGALLDENGNVKKFYGVAAEANDTGINSVSITQINTQAKNDKANDALNTYLTNILSKSEMPFKYQIRNILKDTNMSESQIELYISNLNWVEFASSYIKNKTNLDINKDYQKKETIEYVLNAAGLSEDEIKKAFTYSGYSNWERYTIDFVNRILDNSAKGRDDTMVEVLVSRGLSKDEARSALSKIYGREING